MKNILIGIAGKMQAGKDTLGGMINELTGNKCEIKKFAGKLKQIVSILTGISTEDLEKQEVKDRILGEEWSYIVNLKGERVKEAYSKDIAQINTKYSVRQLLQEVGTDAMRNVIHPNVWVNALFADYKPFIENYPNLTKSNGKDLIEGNNYSMGKAVLLNWIITDVRFPNEAEEVRKRGGKLIKIIRNNDTGNHPSETSLDDYHNWDFIVPNVGTLKDLKYQAEYIADILKIR